MNISRTLPLIVLLLLSLSVISFAWLALPAQYVKITPVPLSNQLSVYIFVNQSGAGKYYPHYPPYDTYHVQGFGARNASVALSMNSSDFVFTCYGGVNSIDYCYTNFIIDTSKVNAPVNMSGANYFSCSSPTTNTVIANVTTDCAQFFGPTYTSMYGADWSMLVVNQTGSIFTNLWTNNVNPTAICMANVVNDGSGYFYFNLYHPDCGGCSPELNFSCNSSSGNKMMCLNHQYILQTSCANGGWSYCNLTSATACPLVNYAGATCNSTTSCASGYTCSCGISVAPTFHNEVCTGSDVGVCLTNKDGTCNDDSQCLSGLCYGKDSGTGYCATPCTTDTNCSTADICTNINTVFSGSSNYRYWCGPGANDYCARGFIYSTSYCLNKLSAFCTGSDSCYSQNCKQECGGGVSRCVIPTYSCYCTSSAECTGGQSCVQLSYSGPESLAGGVYGKKVCVQGKANGQTCSSNSECSSSNCQNGYCCTSGKVCCSVDTECPITQACYTNSGWASTNLYYACNDKKGFASYCREDKECLTPPCTSYQCGGTSTPTYITYTTTLPANNTILVYDIFNITVSYLVSSNNSAVPISLCRLYVDDIPQAYVTCGVISVQMTSTGTHRFYVSGEAFSFATSTTPTLQVIVINPATVNATVGNRCDFNSQCATGRCEFIQEQYYRRCWTSSDCFQGGTCSGADQYLGLQGWCSNLVNYGICCANDTMQCCDPLGSAKCDNAYSGFECNPSTYTCTQVTKSAGTQCNSQSDCNPGLLCLPNSGPYKYCCAAHSSSDYCCNIDSECPTGFVCDSKVGGTYVCTQPSGGQGVGQSCSSTSQCIGDNGASMTCQNGVCTSFACDSGVPCAICLNSTGGQVNMGMQACGIANNTRSLVCKSSLSECTYTGGQQTSSGGAVSGTVTVEDLFSQLLVLLYWVMAVVIIFFIIALFISGLHLAYGLVKR